MPNREVRFTVKDKAEWNEEAVRAAFKDKAFPNLTVKAGP
jgi:hypothetical protein